MSWLSDRLAAGRAARPFPVEPLAARLGIPSSDPQWVAQLAVRLDLDLRWVHRCRRLGLTLMQADAWATRLGVHPAEIWPGYARDLHGIALANANRSTCPQGHPLDRVDSNGFRRCTPCPQEAVRRYKKSRKPQVRRLMAVPDDDARHLEPTMTGMDRSEPIETEWVSVADAASRLRVGTDAVYDACARGDLPHVRVGRVIRINWAAVVGQSSAQEAC